jgi:lysylphosphatidylglycerol synthetase-like protein (DUF2156 family)
MPHAALADSLVAAHAAYVAYVVVGLLLIWIGLARGWRWIRNAWFRLTHLAAIGIVALEAMFGIECPLTSWERQLREAAGQPVSDATFIGRLFHNLLFYEDVPPWVFTILHIGCALLVIATFVLAPPRWSKRTMELVRSGKSKSTSDSPRT